MTGEQGYTLDNLLRPMELTWWEDVKKMIERNTALLCGVVLYVEAIKLVTTIAMLGMAFIKKGIAGLLAVITLLLCPVHQVLKKIRKRAQRSRKIEGEDLQEMDRLSPL